MTAQMIRRFAITGTYLETRVVQTKETVHSFLVNSMKDEGYVPLLDVNPTWQTDYRGGDKFEFVYTLQGVYVGKVKAWESVGVMDGKLIPSSRPSK